MGRNLLAGFGGVVIAGLTIWAIESVGHLVYPPPEGLDFADPDAMQAYIATLPAGAMIFVVAAWLGMKLGSRKATSQ